MMHWAFIVAIVVVIAIAIIYWHHRASDNTKYTISGYFVNQQIPSAIFPPTGNAITFSLYHKHWVSGKWMGMFFRAQRFKELGNKVIIASGDLTSASILYACENPDDSIESAPQLQAEEDSETSMPLITMGRDANGATMLWNFNLVDRAAIERRSRAAIDIFAEMPARPPWFVNELAAMRTHNRPGDSTFTMSVDNVRYPKSQWSKTLQVKLWRDTALTPAEKNTKTLYVPTNTKMVYRAFDMTRAQFSEETGRVEGQKQLVAKSGTELILSDNLTDTDAARWTMTMLDGPKNPKDTEAAPK